MIILTGKMPEFKCKIRLALLLFEKKRKAKKTKTPVPSGFIKKQTGQAA